MLDHTDTKRIVDLCCPPRNAADSEEQKRDPLHFKKKWTSPVVLMSRLFYFLDSSRKVAKLKLVSNIFS